MYEDLKLRKLEELKSKLVPNSAKPYATTVSKVPEEEYKSESTVQYLNESGNQHNSS